jgi:hypothetical protein
VTVIISRGDPLDDISSINSSQVVLQYRPEFARSLPIQILSSGIILTLVAVLFLHLIFTAQFHYSLTQANYVLQLFTVVTLLVLQIVTLHIVLTEAERESQVWPYMLSYAAVNPDPTRWQFGKRVVWCALLETTSALIQVSCDSLLSPSLTSQIFADNAYTVPHLAVPLNIYRPVDLL